MSGQLGRLVCPRICSQYGCSSCFTRRSIPKQGRWSSSCSDHAVELCTGFAAEFDTIVWPSVLGRSHSDERVCAHKRQSGELPTTNIFALRKAGRTHNPLKIGFCQMPFDCHGREFVVDCYLSIALWDQITWEPSYLSRFEIEVPSAPKPRALLDHSQDGNEWYSTSYPV